MRRSGSEPPLLVQVAVALTLFNSWVLFEETVIDRLGWWQYLPCYRVGHFCEWDVAAILVIAAVCLLGFAETRGRIVSRGRKFCASMMCPVCRAA